MKKQTACMSKSRLRMGIRQEQLEMEAILA